MAAFAPLNQIVWRDYSSIVGGLETNVAKNKRAVTENGPCGDRGGTTTCINSGSSYGKHAYR